MLLGEILGLGTVSSDHKKESQKSTEKWIPDRSVMFNYH